MVEKEVKKLPPLETPVCVRDAAATIATYMREHGWVEAIISDSGSIDFRLSSVHELILGDDVYDKILQAGREAGNAKTATTLLAAIAAVQVAATIEDAQDRYDAVFKTFNDKVMPLFKKLGISFDYCDPDTSYEEDVQALLDALKDKIETIKTIAGEPQ